MDSKTFSRGAELSYKTLTTIPAEATLRPLRDEIIVEPLDGVISAIIHVIEERKPVSGIVRAVGPGCWIKQYAAGNPPVWYPVYAPPEKGKRTMVRDSKVFRATQVKVGDRIELDVVRAQALQTFYWGSKLMLAAREEDVAAVHDRAEAA
jgi:hypothetical protein